MKSTRLVHRLFLALAAVAVSGCVSQRIFTPAEDPTTFHFIESTAASVPPQDPAADAPAILIGPSSVAKYLDQPRIASLPRPGEIAYDEWRRWSGPLQENLNRVLADRMAADLGSRRVGSLRVMAGLDWQYRLGYHVDQLDGPRDGPVVFKVSWWIDDPDGRTLHFDRASYQQAVGGGQDRTRAYVRAIEAAVNAWAADVARIVQQQAAR
jgi:uncharacterized protein